MYRKVVLSTAESAEEPAEEPANKPAEDDAYKAEVTAKSKPPSARANKATHSIFSRSFLGLSQEKFLPKFMIPFKQRSVKETVPSEQTTHRKAYEKLTVAEEGATDNPAENEGATENAEEITDDLVEDTLERINGRKSYAGKVSSPDVNMPDPASYKTVDDKLIRETPYNLGTKPENDSWRRKTESSKREKPKLEADETIKSKFEAFIKCFVFENKKFRNGIQQTERKFF